MFCFFKNPFSDIFATHTHYFYNLLNEVNDTLLTDLFICLYLFSKHLLSEIHLAIGTLKMVNC